MAALGCQTGVQGGGTGGLGGSGGSTAHGGSGGCGAGQCPPPPAPSGVAIRGLGGLLVTIANAPHSCTTGPLATCGTDLWWKLDFELPESALVAGTTLPMSSLDGMSDEIPGMDAQGECGYAGGTFDKGTVEVVGVSADHLTLKLTGATLLLGASADGTYDVPICPTGPEPQDGTAIAMRYAELSSPGSSSSSSTGGPVTHPDTLMIFLSNAGQSCADPYLISYECISSRYQVIIALPPEKQSIGTLPLQGLARVNTSEGYNNIPGQCFDSFNTYDDGTIEIVSLGAEEVTLELAGTAALPDAQGNADGTYTAKRCF